MTQLFSRTRLGQVVLLFFATQASLWGQVGGLVGTVSISLDAADATDEPTYLVAGVSLSEDAVFQGAVFSVAGNVLTFSQIQDEESPHINLDPFTPGVFASSQARATAVIDLIDGNLTSITVDYGGSGYVSTPEVKIAYPDSGVDHLTAINAEATATVVSGAITSIDLTVNGLGYTVAPTVTIDGGPHFLRVTETGGTNEGRFFLITANDGTTITLENLAGEDITTLFSQDVSVEVVPAHTLGSVFGTTSCLLGDGNSTTADLVYLYNPSATDADPDSGYVAFYNDGTEWKRESNGSVSNDVVIYPDEAFILARRTTSDLDLEFSGNLLSVDMRSMLPASGAKRLQNNPFGMDVLLTELVASSNLSTDVSAGTKWYADDDEETADSLRILDRGVWTTYWHANVNVGITTAATATAVAGTGPTNAISAADLTLNDGGAGYTSDAKVYFVGGGGTGGHGSATVAGGIVTAITIEDGGTGYVGAPQVVISTGGWRRHHAFDVVADDEVISAGAGILVVRRHPNGAISYLHSDHPSD